MMLNTALEALENPLQTAYAIQHQIAELEMRLQGLKTDYAQVINFCRDKNKTDNGGYHLTVKVTERRSVNPKRFSELFPEANETLLQSHLAYMSTEIEKIHVSGILPSITVENAKKYVGDKELSTACDISRSEQVKIVCDPQQ